MGCCCEFEEEEGGVLYRFVEMLALVLGVRFGLLAGLSRLHWSRLIL